MQEDKVWSILIVEDDKLEQQFIHNTIQKINKKANIYYSSTAEQALQVAYKIPIDIFILDIQLSEGSSGIVLAQELRKIPQYFDNPIIFETTFIDEEINVFRDVRCQTFIQKPLEFDFYSLGKV
jgi:two-component system response regulator LytT